MAKLTKRVMVRLNEEDDAFLNTESERIGVDKSDVIRMMIRERRNGPSIVPAGMSAMHPDPHQMRDRMEGGAHPGNDVEMAELEASEPRAEEVEVPLDDDEYEVPEPHGYDRRSVAPAQYLAPDEPTLRVTGITGGGAPHDAAGNVRVQRHKHLYGNRFQGGFVARAK